MTHTYTRAAPETLESSTELFDVVCKLLRKVDAVS